MAKVNVQYVGKKPFAIDNVTNSGTCWNGNGDVQPMESKAATQLTDRHPDQWRLSESEDGDVNGMKEALAVLTGNDKGKTPRSRRAKAAAVLAAELAGKPIEPTGNEPPAELVDAEAGEAEQEPTGEEPDDGKTGEKSPPEQDDSFED